MICIVGHSGSGKSTIEKALQAKGLTKIVSVTTRQPRAGEVDGVDYHFIHYVDFLSMIKTKLAEYTKYTGNCYGIKKSDCVDDSIAVVEPNGLKQLIADRDLKVIAFYIKTSEETRALRMLQRGDKYDQVNNRIINDRTAFEGVERLVNYTFINESKEDFTAIIKEILKITGR